MYNFWDNFNQLHTIDGYLKGSIVVFGVLATLAMVGHFIIDRKVEILKRLINEESNNKKDLVNKNLSDFVKGRHIPTTMSEEIISNLSTHKNQQAHVTTMMGNAESIKFGRELLSVLRQANWIVADDVAQAVPKTPRSGIILMVRDEPYPKRVKSLIEVFNLIGVEYSVEYWEDWDQFKPGEFDIYIGMKDDA